MIRVERGPEPDDFANHAAEWQTEFEQSGLSASKFWSRVRQRTYMQDEAAPKLREAFHDKCAFCESQGWATSRPQIEHFCPKGQYPNRMFEWSNWLLACAVCNTNKGTYFEYCDDEPCLLDPTVDEPDEHLEFWGVRLIGNTLRGTKTVERLKLNREDLEAERGKWQLTITGWALLLGHNIPEVSDAARHLLIWAMQDDAPYAAMTCAYLREKTPRLANPPTPHAHITREERDMHVERLKAALAWSSPTET